MIKANMSKNEKSCLKELDKAEEHIRRAMSLARCGSNYGSKQLLEIYAVFNQLKFSKYNIEREIILREHEEEEL